MSSAALARSTPLGPQCGKCRRRRVKCDSATPQCQRCQREGLDCPGYATRRQTWTVATPANIHEVVPKTNPNHLVRATAASSTIVDPVIPAAWVAILPLLNLSASLAMPEDILHRQFDEALNYWTMEIRPSFMGCPIPGQPRAMTRREWVALPRIMQHCVAAVTSSHQVARGYHAKTVETNLHAHSGRALAILRHFLDGWERAPCWSALVLVTMMCTIEVMTLSGGPNATWPVHFEAAWKLLGLQAAITKKENAKIQEATAGPAQRKLGGIEKNWKDGLEAEMSCTYLLEIEVFSSTTCPDASLQRRPGILEALEPGAIEGLSTAPTINGKMRRKRKESDIWEPGMLEGLQDRMLLTPSPSPLVVMKAIAEISDLRYSLHAYQNSDSDAATQQMVREPSGTLWSILTALLSFDAPAWVADIAARHQLDGSASSSTASSTTPSTISSTTPSAASFTTPPSPTVTPSTAADSDTASAPPSPWHRAWTSLANAYRSAALIYFFRAFLISRELRVHFPDTLRDFRASAPPLLAAHRALLHKELAFITYRYMRSSSTGAELGEVEDGGEVAQLLSRFMGWPLFVDAYEAVAWPDGSGGEGAGTEKIRRLEVLGRRLGSVCMVDAVGVLQETRERVNDRLRHGAGGVWRWEDGFQWRWIFAV